MAVGNNLPKGVLCEKEEKKVLRGVGVGVGVGVLAYMPPPPL